MSSLQNDRLLEAKILAEIEVMLCLVRVLEIDFRQAALKQQAKENINFFKRY